MGLSFSKCSFIVLGCSRHFTAHTDSVPGSLLLVFRLSRGLRVVSSDPSLDGVPSYMLPSQSVLPPSPRGPTSSHCLFSACLQTLSPLKSHLPCSGLQSCFREVMCGQQEINMWPVWLLASYLMATWVMSCGESRVRETKEEATAGAHRRWKALD